MGDIGFANAVDRSPQVSCVGPPENSGTVVRRVTPRSPSESTGVRLVGAEPVRREQSGNRGTSADFAFADAVDGSQLGC